MTGTVPQPQKALQWTGTLLSTARSEMGVIVESHVPLQQNFTGDQFTLPDNIANTYCSSLGVDQTLELLNHAMQTTHFRTPEVEALIQRCIEENYDFGTALSFIHRFWEKCPNEALFRLDIARKADEELRRKAVNGDFVKKDTPPRRVWDLHTNRVIPYYWADMSVSTDLFAISHSWVDEDARTLLRTPVNGGQWEVPIPNDTTLSRIHIEVLNATWIWAGRQRLASRKPRYVWVDILCLR
jgi:hypothetical protein